MEPIRTELVSWLAGKRHIAATTADAVRKDAGFQVKDFPHLVKKVASLAYNNQHLELLFRGQPRDFTNGKGHTSLYPRIFRTKRPNERLTGRVAMARFKTLSDAEHLLCKEIQSRHVKGTTHILRYRVLQWAILQHYEIADTPFLDVTHSLRVACSFALEEAKDKPAYLYALGLPYLSGCITTAADQDLQILRLLSICPSTALRPHYQEGYLVGEYPDMRFEAKTYYWKDEWDFGRRLVCKFKLTPAKDFWTAGFDALPDRFLKPPHDKFQEIADAVRGALKK